MQGKIVLPEKHKTRWTVAHKTLFSYLAEAFDLQVVYDDKPKFNGADRLVIAHAIPHHSQLYNVQPFTDLPSTTKLVVYPRDLQTYGRVGTDKSFRAIFDRADLIISPAKQLFNELWPDYVEKMKWIVDYFGPHEAYAYLEAKDQQPRCLLSGACNSTTYPFRQWVINNRRKNTCVDYIPPPYNNQHKYVGANYARLLNKYVCCVTCGSIFNYLLAKHIEIPAANSLLLTTENDDLRDAGFVAGKHYLKVDFDNVIGVIEIILKAPDKYAKVRATGADYVRNNHSVLNRFFEFTGWLEDLGFERVSSWNSLKHTTDLLDLLTRRRTHLKTETPTTRVMPMI